MATKDRIKNASGAVAFTATIEKFGTNAEKTGWTYIIIPAACAQQLKPGNKRSFRVKGNLDSHEIRFVALMPMGKGEFLLGINADMRKAIRKRAGEMVSVSLIEDKEEPALSSDLTTCLADEPAAREYFEQLPASQKRYFSNWVDAARTESTKTARLVAILEAFTRKLDYGEMMRLYRNSK